jgi:hypothetical protein
VTVAGILDNAGRLQNCLTDVALARLACALAKGDRGRSHFPDHHYVIGNPGHGAGPDHPAMRLTR